MNDNRQFVLDLGHRAALGRDDFLVTPANSDAVAWIDRWPDWPGHALALFGSEGCGKTHLAHVFAARSVAHVMPGAALTREAVAPLVEAHAALALEDADAVADDRALLHLFNAMKERGGALLLTARDAPARWRVSLPDLSSRLAAVTAVKIAPPDEALMEALLIKLFADRQIAVDPDVVSYVVRRIDRSFAAARDVAARADAASLTGQRAVTIPLMKQVLDLS